LWYGFFVARRRRGVGDDVGKFVSDIVSPWLGSKPATPPQVVRGKEVVKTLVQQADLVTGGYGRAAMAGPTELAKQAAINLAVGGAGYGVGRAAQAAVMSGRVVNPVAAVRNLVKGERVIVHGTQNVLEGNALIARAGSLAAPNVPTVFGWNPRAKGMKGVLPTNVMRYSGGAGYIAVGTASKAATKLPYEHKAITATTKNVPIRQVVPVSGKSPDRIDEELSRAVRRAGSYISGDSAKQRAANELRRWKARKADRTSTA
jgi:hypothetical protein